MYFVNILGSRYEKTWNLWLETKAREDRKKMLYELEEGVNIRERSLLDSLYQSAISRSPVSALEPLPVPPTVIRPLQEEAPINQVIALPVRSTKMNILQKVLKAPLIKLKNRLARHH